MFFNKILLFFLLFTPIVQAQNGYDNIWNLGYGGNSPALPPWFGNFQIRFSPSGIDNFILNNYGCDIFFTNAGISDYTGNFYCYTNGFYVGNAAGDTMLNGSDLWKTGGQGASGINGSDVNQGAIILPDPSNSNKFLLFHVSDSVGAGGYVPPLDLYMSGIDMTLDGGLGAVTFKNVSVLHDSLISGYLTACKHANGRDWWLVTTKLYSNLYYKLLITPNGIAQIDTQSIGSIRGGKRGQACFSPNGAHYAQNDNLMHLQILDFDRCTGQFSNPNFMTINDFNLSSGVCFSANSSLLYASGNNYIYQFKLDTSDVIASRITVAVNDSAWFYDSLALTAFANGFCQMLMAQDGIIYLIIPNVANRIGRILNSNVRGVGCNVDQHSLLLPRYTFWGLPNYPNYHLGSETGSICDSLPPWVVGQNYESRVLFKPFIYPNPVIDEANLVLPNQNHQGTLKLYDSTGHLLIQKWYQVSSSEIKINTVMLSEGLYYYNWQEDEKIYTGKLLVSGK